MHLRHWRPVARDAVGGVWVLVMAQVRFCKIDGRQGLGAHQQSMLV